METRRQWSEFVMWGDDVVFNVPFEHAGIRVERNDIGVVDKVAGPLGYITVEANRHLWLCKPGEIQLAKPERKRE